MDSIKRYEEVMREKGWDEFTRRKQLSNEERSEEYDQYYLQEEKYTVKIQANDDKLDIYSVPFGKLKSLARQFSLDVNYKETKDEYIYWIETDGFRIECQIDKDEAGPF